MTIPQCKVKHLFNTFFFLFLSSALLLTSCAEPSSTDPETTVEQTLENLGIDTTDSARSDAEGDSLPEDYTPLGSSRSFEKLDEFALLGISLDASQNVPSTFAVHEFDRVGSSASYTRDSLFTPAVSLTPWGLSVGDNPDVLRTAARADIDRDGLEELVVLHRDTAGGSVAIQVYEDQPDGFATGQSLVVTTDPITGLAMTEADVNGDGYFELVIGLTGTNSARLLVIDNDAGSLTLSTTSLSLPLAYSDSDIELIVTAGNIDYDPSFEIAVVINELQVTPSLTGNSRLVVFDDAKASFNTLLNTQVHSEGLNRTAQVADVSVGDVDGDNMDEVILGGLTHFDPTDICQYDYLLIALDDAENAFDNLGAAEKPVTLHDGCASSAGQLRFVHVNTLDLDGDGFAEIQANELIFEDFAQYPSWTALLDSQNATAVIPQSSLFEDNGGFTGYFGSTNSAMAGADVTSDKKQDVVFYSQATNRFEVWGLSEPDEGANILLNEWRMLASFDIEPPASDDVVRPMVIPLNVNYDSLVVTFDEGKYQLVFTEPVIIATLAAAPCYDNLGQNEDACRTSYGTSESTTVDIENTLTISAGVTVGVSAEFSDPITAIRISEASAKLKVSASLSLSHSAAYTYTEQIVYTTGPIEDTVIFTSIPYDVYTYTITSHEDADLIGTQVIVSMPREPVTLQVERSFYNANVAHDGPKIDSSVYQHTPGDPSTYPTSLEKDGLIARYSSLLPTQWAYDFGPTSVGQGGGDTTLDINIATESGFGVGVGISAEFEVEATAGIFVAGFSVGVTAESALQITHGDESMYTGSVANLPTSEFADNYYSWGLFTYSIDDHPSGQVFEVINYWVE